MAMNEQFKWGSHLSYGVPVGAKAGEPVRIGVMNGWIENDPGTGGNPEGRSSVNMTGAFQYDVTGALTEGQAVYIKADRSLTATQAGSAALFGAAVIAKPAAAKAPAVVAVAKFGPATA